MYNYRAFHLDMKGQTCFSEYHGTFSKMDQTPEHKASPNRSKKIVITPCPLTDHQRLKLHSKNNKKHKSHGSDLLTTE